MSPVLPHYTRSKIGMVQPCVAVPLKEKKNAGKTFSDIYCFGRPLKMSHWNISLSMWAAFWKRWSWCQNTSKQGLFWHIRCNAPQRKCRRGVYEWNGYDGWLGVSSKESLGKNFTAQSPRQHRCSGTVNTYCLPSSIAGALRMEVTERPLLDALCTSKVNETRFCSVNIATLNLGQHHAASQGTGFTSRSCTMEALLQPRVHAESVAFH